MCWRVKDHKQCVMVFLSVEKSMSVLTVNMHYYVPAGRETQAWKAQEKKPEREEVEYTESRKEM